MADFSALHAKAHVAGMAAGESKVPTPMVVTGGVPGEQPKSYYVADGACGFAWVKMKGNTPFARWAKKAGVARSWSTGGVVLWVSEFNQSMARKEAYANAYAKVLKEAGVEAYADSRMD